MTAPSFLTRELEQEILSVDDWRSNSLQFNALVARITASIGQKHAIGVHILADGSRVPPSMLGDVPIVDVDPCVEPIEEGRQYYIGVPNDYGLRPPGASKVDDGILLYDLLETSPAALADVYRVGPLSSNHSTLSILEAVISAHPGTTLAVSRATSTFEHHYCPDQAAAPYMLVVVQEILRSVAAQYLAIVADATVLTHPRDLAWKTHAVTGYKLDEVSFDITDAPPQGTDSIVTDLLRLLNIAYTKGPATPYAQHICALYDWAVRVAARWKQNNLQPPRTVGTIVHWDDYVHEVPNQTTYTEQERQTFPAESLMAIERLIAETTIVLVLHLQRRILKLAGRYTIHSLSVYFN